MPFIAPASPQGFEVPAPEPECHVDQADEGWHLDERTDDRREGRAVMDAERRHRDGNRQLEVVRRRGEGKRR